MMETLNMICKMVKEYNTSITVTNLFKENSSTVNMKKVFCGMKKERNSSKEDLAGNLLI